jgi:hypothetical protein
MLTLIFLHLDLTVKKWFSWMNDKKDGYIFLIAPAPQRTE